MVDFSCALNLSMPIAVLSAIRECSANRITAKGGKFLETIAKADTIVFDKTGTLTKAEPRVRGVVSYNGMDEDELLRMAACLEELALVPGALVVYESPRRVAETLARIAEVLPRRKVALVRELTKIHEEVVRGTAAEVAQEVAAREALKGECVVVIGAPSEEELA
jgi:cation transport ATPase